ncbi:RNA polymerase subunit sigma-70 [Conexibacter sp. DBS9H8]|uniref:RNA polymerase subunit sigma-70 n=1 Tax=Conexibacter sp. DBS9H8 TaxID=2937801 RepID=UPI00200D0032|nr:RNA polymerase subunit sigma-70 [Conexibacter sp. DBS9H8]
MITILSTPLLERASRGDELAFRELTDPLRRELELHCYRMLGSLHDAEDVLQETMLAAWRSLAEFERRASLRTWLYRIATNRCLNALRDASRRPPVAPEPPFPIPAPTRMSDPHWLEPYPEDRLGWLADAVPGPAARYEARESVEITFLGALQQLSGRQRAVLVLRDVLGFRADETAAMLEMSVDAVKSALRRARTTLAEELPDRLTPPAARSPEERDLLERFVQAFVADDIDGMVALVTEHAWFRMPPANHEYHGPGPIGRFLAAIAEWRTGMPARVLPARVNFQPALGVYRIAPATGLAMPVGLLVLTLTGSQIAALTWFIGPTYMGRLGLPSDPCAPELVSDRL